MSQPHSNNLTGAAPSPGKVPTARIPPHCPNPTSLPFVTQLPASAPAGVPELAANTPENGTHANDGTSDASLSDSLAGDDEYHGRSREPLCCGDVLFFYTRTGTGGKPEDGRTAEVTRVFSTDDEDYDERYPVLISTDEFIDYESLVKRVYCSSGDQHIPIPNGEGGKFFRPVGRFKLVPGGSGRASDGVMNAAASFSAIATTNIASFMAAQRESGFAPENAVNTFIGGSARQHHSVIARKPPPPVLEFQAPSSSIGGSNPQVKCSVQYCPKLHEVLEACSNPACARTVHNACSARMLKTHKGKDGAVIETPDGTVFCTKKCAIYYQKSQDVSLLAWNNDGKNGKDDPNHSERVLVRYISNWDNYNSYRQGGGGGGSSKLAICKEVLVPLLKSNNVRLVRTPTQIRDKIQWFEGHFRDAIQWAGNTGQGVKENEGNVRFEELLEQRCPYYFDLAPVFRERAGMVPPLTSDELHPPLGDVNCDDNDDVSFLQPVVLNGETDQDYMNDGSEDDNDLGDSQKEKANSKPPASQHTPKPKKKSRTRSSPYVPGTASSSALQDLVALRLERLREKKKEESYVSDDIRKTVALAKQFKELVDCLGDRVQAALIVPEFKVFLKPAEKTEYDEKAKSDESSD